MNRVNKVNIAFGVNPSEKNTQADSSQPFYLSSIYKDFPLTDNFYSRFQQPKEDIKAKNKLTAKRVALTAGGIVTVMALLSGGAFSRIYRRSSDLYSDLSQKVQASELSGQTKTFLSSVETVLSRGFKKVLDVFKLSANTVAVRDSGVDKLLEKTKPTSRFANWLRRVFGNIATNELDRRYDTVERTMRHFSAEVSDMVSSSLSEGGEKLEKVITIKGKSQTLGEWLKELGSEVMTLKSDYEGGFSKDARILREKFRAKGLSDLPERQWNKIVGEGGVFNLKKYKNYITVELTEDTREELAKEISSARKLFTNNVKHEYKSIRSGLRELSDILKMDDKEGRTCLAYLHDGAEKFRKCHGATEGADRQAIIKEMGKFLDDLSSRITENGKYTPDKVNVIQKEIDSLREVLNESGMQAQGTLQRISTILKGLSSSEQAQSIISEKEFSQIKKSIHSMTGKLNSASNLEMDDYFIKKAEIKIGSAPTDMFGLLGPVGLGAYAIARGKTKDEKVEAALTTAIPLIGGIGTYIFGTVRMFSAPKNLVFSTITGAALNLLGQQAVKLYRAYQEKQSLVKVALSSYKNLIGQDNKINK
ncbi:hypothetical protein IKQ26_06180 [bacterium]|nr:hypothetical protein [bacterium]